MDKGAAKAEGGTPAPRGVYSRAISAAAAYMPTDLHSYSRCRWLQKIDVRTLQVGWLGFNGAFNTFRTYRAFNVEQLYCKYQNLICINSLE